MKIQIFILLVALFSSQLSNGQVLSIELENDILAGNDSDYTHGTRLEWRFKDAPIWLETSAGKMPVFWSEPGAFDYSIALGQDMFTPNDLENPEPIEDDRPYAGYLYFGAIARKTVSTRTTFLELDLGVVGPSSGAEDTQETIHRWTGSTMPMGWDNQLHDEPTLQLQYWESRGVTLAGNQKKWSIDMVPRFGGLLGNVQIAAIVGADARIGYNMPTSQGPGVIVPTGISIKEKIRKTYGYLFFGTEGRAYAWNIFLDGNTDGDSLSVEKETVVTDFRVGAGIGFGDFDLLYTVIYRSREYEEQDALQEYSSLAISYEF